MKKLISLGLCALLACGSVVALPGLSRSMESSYRPTFVPSSPIVQPYKRPVVGQVIRSRAIHSLGRKEDFVLLVVSDCTGCNANRVGAFRKMFPQGVVASYKILNGDEAKVPEGADVLLSEEDAKALGLSMVPCLYKLDPKGRVKFIQSESEGVEQAFGEVLSA